MFLKTESPLCPMKGGSSFEMKRESSTNIKARAAHNKPAKCFGINV